MSKRKWTIEDLVQAVCSEENITGVVKKIGLRHSSNNTDTILKYISEYKLDISHWKTPIIKQVRTGYELPIEEVFVKNSTFTKSHLREKIIKNNLLPYECSECHIGPSWNDKTLTLQVDHINGDNSDHRIENLRFLCPNCHSQTTNYAGANALNRKPAETFICDGCGNYRSRVSESGLCIKCFSSQDRIVWPNDEEIIKMIKMSNINQTAKQLGVSYPGLKKRLERHKLFERL